jgi:hypothetical protein
MTTLEEERRVVDLIRQELVKDEKIFAEEEAVIDLFAYGETKDIVQLEVVCGEMMAVLRSTLRLCKDSVLYCQFDDTAWCQGSRESGNGSDYDGDANVVLVEQPAYAFKKLIDQLRLMFITPPDMDTPRPFIAPHEESNFHAVVNYYFPGMEDFIIPPPPHLFDSSILENVAYQLLLIEWVKESLSEPADITSSLLYQSSEHGFRAAAFHSLCDNKGATVPLIKSTDGFIFGGYSDKSWTLGDGNSEYKFVRSDHAFLFSFVNPSEIGPTKLSLIGGDSPHGGDENDYALCHEKTKGPSFGGGCDLRISDHSNINDISYSWLGISYEVPAGQFGDEFLTGSKSFRVAAIEVFAVQSIE